MGEDPGRKVIEMDQVAAILRVALDVLALWTLASVVVALPVAALFRAQARRELRWRQAERRRMWLDAAR